MIMVRNELIFGYAENWLNYDSELQNRIIETVSKKMGPIGYNNLQVAIELFHNIKI